MSEHVRRVGRLRLAVDPRMIPRPRLALFWELATVTVSLSFGHGYGDPIAAAELTIDLPERLADFLARRWGEG